MKNLYKFIAPYCMSVVIADNEKEAKKIVSDGIENWKFISTTEDAVNNNIESGVFAEYRE